MTTCCRCFDYVFRAFFSDVGMADPAAAEGGGGVGGMEGEGIKKDELTVKVIVHRTHS